MSMPYPMSKAVPKERDDAAWAVAMRRQQFGYAEISAEGGSAMALATRIVKGWVAEGRARAITEKIGSSRILFEVIPEEELRLPLVGDATQQMWTSMRKLRSFTPPDLSSTCSIPVQVIEARSYCQVLLQAGYLRVQVKARPGNRDATYRLVNATGVKAPRLKRLRCLIDENEGRIIPMVEVRG